MRLFPPHFLLAAVILMTLVDRFVPVVKIIASPYGRFGIPLIALGVGIVLWGARAFRRAETPIKPFEESTALVTHGLYRVTRNPIYVGMVLALVGVNVWLGSIGPMPVIVAFIIIIERRFIRFEERDLQRIFGDAYVEYKSRVRRWI